MPLSIDPHPEGCSISERIFLPALTAVFIYIVLMVAPEKLLNDGDTLWHIVLGQKILERWQLPKIDEFSYLFFGEPYRTNSWLSDVLLGAAYNFGGFVGVVVIAVLCVAITFFFLQREFARSLSSKWSIYFCCAVFILLSPHILSRPHVLVFPLVTLWAIFLLKAEEKGQAPDLIALVVLFLWVNMHGSFLLGMVLTVPICAQSIFNGRDFNRENIRNWGIFGIGMIGVAVIGPYGFGPLQTAFTVLGVGPLLNSIQEWQPQEFSSFGIFEGVILLTIGVIAYGGVRLSPARVVLILGLLHMALSHARNTDYLAIIGALILAAPTAEAIKGRELYIDAKRLLPWFLMVATLMTLATFHLRDVSPIGSAYPLRAMKAAREFGAQGRVLNDYAFGGSLIFNNQKVFIDSRAEFYPRSFLEQYLRLFDGSSTELLEDTLKKDDIQWTLIASNRAINETFKKLDGWREVYRDEFAVVHMKSK